MFVATVGPVRVQLEAGMLVEMLLRNIPAGSAENRLHCRNGGGGNGNVTD